MRKISRIGLALASGVLGLFLCQCETMESALNEKTLVTKEVTGVMHYPDEANHRFILKTGSEIIGAGGTNCSYVIEDGAKLSAHSGTNNQYLVKKGGAFRGFTHPATNCRVKYEEGSIVEQEQMGEGTSFEPLFEKIVHSPQPPPDLQEGSATNTAAISERSPVMIDSLGSESVVIEPPKIQQISPSSAADPLPLFKEDGNT